MQPGVGPEKPIQTQFSGQPQYINQQIQQSQGAFPQQQIIIIMPNINQVLTSDTFLTPYLL